MIKSNLVRRTVLISMSILMTSAVIGCTGGNNNTNVNISADATRESSTEVSTEDTLPETLEEEETTEEAKMYTIEEVSVKAEPKEDAEELGKLDSGVEVDITGKEDGYVSIDYDGEVGWILETSVAEETKEAGVSESEAIEIIQSVESNDIIGGNETDGDKEVTNNETSKSQSSNVTNITSSVANNSSNTTTTKPVSSTSNSSSTKPQATQPATKPVETTQAQTQPVTKPVETQPVQTQPQTQPTTKPVETTPAQTTQAPTQPVETTTVAPTQPVRDEYAEGVQALRDKYKDYPIILSEIDKCVKDNFSLNDINSICQLWYYQIEVIKCFDKYGNVIDQGISGSWDQGVTGGN